MKKEEINKQSSITWKDYEKLSDVTQIGWKENKSAIWEEMESRMETSKPATVIFFFRPAFRYAVAALFILLVGITGLLRFYSHSVETLSGQHLTVSLPDGSQVQLNAESTLKYYPLWWSIERKLSFSGEAFFEVEKGNRFVVNSFQGQTKVLGTSFNIYSRENDYRVNCLTGKVQVKASNAIVILMPNDQAELNDAGSFYVRHEVKPESTISWIDNEFFFTSVPFPEVVKEIERQYGVKIQVPPTMNRNYTGNFSREEPIEDVLGLLSRSFGAKFVQKQQGEYQIIPNN
ncbi:FecR family protein [Sunxiuqinia sp. A32]|uniref:FecR family protein n=1 Tax=Sunxiuqinia sp. A32 TaxID=3461496 RepID=UPI00404670B0